ncbi:MAG: hypothetical protein RLZZ169_1031, partial [Pseudomonadota bacterium]
MSDIYFAQIREDGLVERGLLARHPAREVVCIGSGGCTAFALVDRAPAITVVDANPSQIHLIELKLAAVASFEREEYMGFIGEADCKCRLAMYDAIKGRLSVKAAAYWGRHSARIALGINRAGATERFYAHFSKLLCNVVIGRDRLEGLFH